MIQLITIQAASIPVHLEIGTILVFIGNTNVSCPNHSVAPIIQLFGFGRLQSGIVDTVIVVDKIGLMGRNLLGKFH